MSPNGAVARLVTWAAIVCAVASAGTAMDLSEMPPWVRAMIQPVHLGTAAQVETVQVGDTGAPVPAPAIVGRAFSPTPPPATGAGVHIPGLGLVPVDGGVSLRAWGTPGAGAVHAPGMGGPPAPAPVSICAAAEEWTEAVGSIEGLDRETLARAGQILAMIRERGMSADEFAEWTAEHRPTPEVLSAAVAMVGFHRHENYPTPQPEALALASGLAVLAGDDLSQVEAIPPFGRLWLAILFSKRGDAQKAERSFDSMTDEQLVRLPRETTVMTIAHLIRDVPRGAVPVIKHWAEAMNEEAVSCHDLHVACLRTGDADVVRSELIPWAEAALQMSPTGSGWLHAITALLWAWTYVGEPGTAAERGEYWLRRGAEGGVPGDALNVARVRIAECVAASGDLATAAQMFGRIIASGPPPAAESALALLMDLGDLTLTASPDSAALPGELRRVWPETLSIGLSSTSPTSHIVRLAGSRAFRVTGLRTTSPVVSASVGAVRKGMKGVIYEIEVGVSPDPPLTAVEAEVQVLTNDRRRKCITIPVTTRPGPAVDVVPSHIFFGFVEVGQTAEREVVIRSRQAFTVLSVRPSHPDAIHVEAPGAPANHHELAIRLRAGPAEGVVEGQIVFETDLERQQEVVLSYYAQIVGARHE